MYMDIVSLFGQTYDYTTTTATTDDGNGMGVIIGIVLGIISIIALWKVFQKAKQPGWAAIIPIYNVYVLLKVVGRPGWWVLLYLIPFVNIIVHLVVALDAAKSFGKSPTFGVFGLWLFSFIGYMIVGFGDARYKGPAVSSATTRTA
jgi:hypothetical protein